MKVTLVYLGLTTDAIGIRILSSILKQQGHQTQLIFLPTVKDMQRRTIGGIYSYNEDILNKIITLCQESQLIGISLMTHHYTIAKLFTEQLKRHLSAPVIWGGIHPTVNPEECLETADLVCVGEGETSVPELVRRLAGGQDIDDIPGIWLKQHGRLIANGPGPLAQDLDSLPFPDYSFSDHHLLVDEVLKPMTSENWNNHLCRFFPPFNCPQPGQPCKPAYQILSARGCPFSCTFCGEAPLMSTKNYGRRYFRKRGIDNVMTELQWVKETFPFIGEICFCDDTFASRSLAEIKDFCRQYKEKINMPFYILVSPVNVVKSKLDLLMDAGLTNIGMGIQSGSSRIIEIYNRERCGSVEHSLRAAHLLNSYRDRLLPYYDFIVENPYETREDLLETVRLLVDLPRPYVTRVYALSFFPGTPLYEKASADGMLFAGMYEKTFGQRTQVGYLSFIIDMNKYSIPRSLLKILISEPFLKVFNNPAMDPVFMTIHHSLKWLALKVRFHQTGLT
jgi:anaerobic magnesium-protoporphyrin IX monomethyl ester cyclase